MDAKLRIIIKLPYNMRSDWLTQQRTEHMENRARVDGKHMALIAGMAS